MQSPAPLPPFNYHGYLPEGVHETTLEQIQERFVINPKRVVLWERLRQFLNRVISTGDFAQAYIDGGFITNKSSPEDIDVILQTRAPYGPEAFVAIAPFYADLDAIYAKYSVHLHFWIEGCPDKASDFRLFFQYIRPQEAAPLGLKEGARKGIALIKL